MKKYPYIKIILFEFWKNKRDFILENEIINITGVFKFDDGKVLGIHFIKDGWHLENMLDLPVSYYNKRLQHYKSIEREFKLKELGL